MHLKQHHHNLLGFIKCLAIPTFLMILKVDDDGPIVLAPRALTAIDYMVVDLSFDALMTKVTSELLI